MFQVRFYNENRILGYVSGRIRHSFIHILPGDKVKMKISDFDSSGGRIILKPRNQNSND
uniref:Translation initiation factor 1 n=1 Tax=Senna multiglandulosa TaxID=1574110 RepID=A0AA95ZA98_9FABA|nr:translation initiation factor 1 [Senna multiglandulosa]WNI02379.1 translation initiation factor 1 [Senna multiglandulosa]